jgi:Leucine-rich repeat (LRR) protein
MQTNSYNQVSIAFNSIQNNIPIDYLYISPDGSLQQANEPLPLFNTLILSQKLKARFYPLNTPSPIQKILELAQERLYEQFDKPLLSLDEGPYTKDGQSEFTIIDAFSRAFYLSRTYLDMPCRQLCRIPKVIGLFSQLHTLNLSYNSLVSLPPEISHLHALKILNLRGNPLTSLPPEIGNLSKLETLDLAANALTSLPHTIGNLSKLEYLGLEENQLTSLPPAIGNLFQLRDLDLCWNRLTSLPPAIGNLFQLRDLPLGSNQLTSLPPAIGNLVQLRSLNLSENRLTSVPTAIGDLFQLRYLDFNHNQLTSLLPAIGNLSQLTQLFLHGNQLTSLPQSFFSLSTDCTVDLGYNAFSLATVQQIQHIIDERGVAQLQHPIIEDISINDSLSQSPFLTLNKAIEYWTKLASAAELSVESLSKEVQTALLSLLTAAQRAPQAENTITRTLLAKRLIKLLQAFISPSLEQLRPQLLALIKDATGTCGDRVELRLLQMELLIKMHRISLEHLSVEIVQSSLPLLLGFYYWQRLEEIARCKTMELKTQRHAVDEVEVHLAYLVKLKDRLHLPLEASSMRYEACSGLKDEDYQTAAETLLAETSTPKEQTKALCLLDIWRCLMEKHLTHELKALKDPLHEELENMSFSNEQEYIKHAKDLKEHMEREEAQLIYHTTLALLQKINDHRFS